MLKHIPLNVRASLYLRLVDFFSFDIGPDDISPDDSEAALIIRHLLKSAATKALDKVNTSVELSNFLHELQEKFDQHPSLQGAELQNSLAERVAVMRKNLTQLNCRRCAQQAFLPPCCGNDKQDSLLVDRIGECFTWLLSVFAFIVNEYQNRIAYISNWQFPDLRFNTSNCIATNTRLRGLTQYLTKTVPAEVIVELIIPNKIDVNNLLSFAYVISHEIICHAYQKVGFSGSVVFERPEDCPFTEGWMDAASFNLLRDFFEHPLKIVPNIVELIPEEILASSKERFHSRYQKNFDRHVPSRENGMSVYKNFAKFVMRYSDQFSNNNNNTVHRNTTVLSTMTEISFLINAMADDDDAENFILYCGLILGYSTEVPGYSGRCQSLFEIIKPFLLHRNMPKLLKELNQAAIPFMAK